jgi:prepilin-type processing-associated H-X9-DG protein
LLPYIEQENVWKEIEAAFASDPDRMRFYGHEPHHRMLGVPVLLFNCPADSRLPGPHLAAVPVAFTSYLGVSGSSRPGNDGMLYLDSRVRFSDVTDGTSNTFMVGERPPSADYQFGWWYRGWGQEQSGSCEMLMSVREMNVTFRDCPPGPYDFKDGTRSDKCDAFHFWSLHTGGANMLMADGSVKFALYSINDLLPALATRSGAESVSMP